MKKFLILFITSLMLVGCESNEKTTPTETPEPTPEVEKMSEEKNKYFESDDVIDGVFEKYNEVAELQIPIEEIEKGNIRTKALVYYDDLFLEIINVDNDKYLSISIESKEKDISNEYIFFRDLIRTIKPNVPEDEIAAVWNEIMKLNSYAGRNEDLYFGDINIDFFPSKPRIDLKIPY